MKKIETYRRLIGCPNCSSNQELHILKGVVKKDYVIPPETLCTNCGCRLDGKVAPDPKPPPEPETAFQGIVRKVVVARSGTENWLTVPWSEIERQWSFALSETRAAFNATLDLASATVFAEYGMDPDGSIACDMIKALKEPTP